MLECFEKERSTHKIKGKIKWNQHNI
jgi:hypothetical protein